MKNKKSKLPGLIILILVIVLAAGYAYYSSSMPSESTLKGLLGGEKIGLFEDPDFEQSIDKKYRIQMDYRKAGSLDMVKETAKNNNQEGYDYLFPSSQLALELYKKQGGGYKEQDLVFNTPIVLYSWKPVVQALTQKGIVSESEGINYVDMTQLAKTIAQGTSWADLGLPELYGNIFVDTTDPQASNSGNMFLGLLANSLNGGKVLTQEGLSQVLPEIQSIYQQIGAMQGSSADMFSQFLRLGYGSYPIIAGYESQILELSKADPNTYQQIKDSVVILYPKPTVWSSHVYIALTENGQRGLEALKDPETQDLAWKKHGFRTIISGTADLTEFAVPGIPESIQSVMPMPSIDVMLQLMQALQTGA